MPRPNHDIPNLLLGGVRDYAEQTDTDPETAHIHLLRLALTEVGIFNGGAVGADEQLDGESDRDDTTGGSGTDDT